MNRRLAIVLMLAAANVFGADLPKAESLLDRYVEVTGGKHAYAARKSEVARRTMEYPAMGLKGKASTYHGEKGEYRASMEMPGIGAMDFGVNDGIAWQTSILTGPRILNGAERSEALKDATLDAEYNWRKLYSKAETVGEEAFNGEASYHVRMTPNGDEPESWFFSTKSGLLLGMRIVTSTQQGDVPMEVVYGEYKKFGGVMKPAKETQKAAGQEFTLTLESMDVNAEIPAAQFAIPADVAALVAKQGK